MALAVVETDNVKAAEFVGAALGVELGAEPVALGVEARSISNALASCERPAGALLLECQGQFDIGLAWRCARKLAARMAGDGRVTNEVTTADAAAAACLALTVWRSTGRGADGQVESLAARVAWRAVVLDISADTLGDSVALHSVSDDWLFAQASRGWNVWCVGQSSGGRWGAGRCCCVVSRHSKLMRGGGGCKLRSA